MHRYRLTALLLAVFLLAGCTAKPVEPAPTVTPTMQEGHMLLPNWDEIPTNEVLPPEEDEPKVPSAPEQTPPVTEQPPKQETPQQEPPKQETPTQQTPTELAPPKQDPVVPPVVQQPDPPADEPEPEQDPEPEAPSGSGIPITPNTPSTPVTPPAVTTPPVQDDPEPIVPSTPVTPPAQQPDPPVNEPEPETPAFSDELTVKNSGAIVTGDAYDILCRIVQNEIGSSYATEAIKAMAVASYSYVKFYNEYLNSAPTVALSSAEPGQRVKDAVSAVFGEAVYYNGRYANCTYFAVSAGVTTSALSVWNTPQYPYLVSVDSSVDMDYKTGWSSYEQTKTFTAEALAEKCNAKLGTALDPANDDPATWLEILSYSDAPYVATVRVGNVTTTGRNLRENVLSLRSHAFEIEYDEAGRIFTFTTYGYGHGVGMSQAGANFYAQQGWDYIDILTHYYSGTTVE